MTLSGSIPDSSKFFTNDWIITIPSHPFLKYHRCSPAYFTQLFAFESDRSNNPFAAAGVKNRIRTPEILEAGRKTMLHAYINSPQTHLALTFIIEREGKLIGSGGIQGRGNWANIGCSLIPGARGQGIGTVTTKLMLRLSSEVRVDSVGMGTMRDNQPQRGLMRKLGLEETVEDKELPVLGVVQEIQYKGVVREEWQDFDFDVEFLESGPSDFAEA